MSFPHTGGGESLVHARAAIAHLEDSLAPAELVPAAELATRLGLQPTPTKLAHFLTKAWLLYEYALATPSSAGDEEAFSAARQNLLHIVEREKFNPRHPTKLNAQILLLYEPAFLHRATHGLVPVTEDIKNGIGHGLADIMLDFLGDEPLTEGQHGQLAELVALGSLLKGPFFPFPGSRREESNMVPQDNHDFYTLHPCDTQLIKKVPISVKYRQGQAYKTLRLVIGHLTHKVAKMTPVYKEQYSYLNLDVACAKATRLAADIIICDLFEEKLSDEDQFFLDALVSEVTLRVERFANTSPSPDYVQNALALGEVIIGRTLADENI